MKNAFYENVKRNAAFPLRVALNDTERNCSGGRHFIYSHWHSDCEFIYLTEGSAVIEVDMQKYELSAGEAVFVQSGQVHSGYVQEGIHCKLYAVVFNPEFISSKEMDSCQEKYIEPLIRGNCKLPSVIRGKEARERTVLQCLERLVESYNRAEYGFELEVKAMLYCIFAGILSRRNLQAVAQPQDAARYSKIIRLKKVIQHIEDHYEKRISIAELAATAGMSTHHFYKFFKSLAGVTPIEYINRYRMYKAEGFLREGRMTVLEAALNAGFENVSYFIRLFKKVYGFTPGKLGRGGR